MKRYITAIFLCIFVNANASTVYVIQQRGVQVVGSLQPVDPYRNPVTEGMQRQVALQQQIEQLRQQRIQNQQQELQLRQQQSQYQHLTPQYLLN